MFVVYALYQFGKSLWFHNPCKFAGCVRGLDDEISRYLPKSNIASDNVSRRFGLSSAVERSVSVNGTSTSPSWLGPRWILARSK